jgi:hypothetical protein
VRVLLRKGANVKARNHGRETVLHAVLKEYWSNRNFGPSGSHILTVLQVLLDAGAEINAGGGSCDTVLDIACNTYDSELIDFLVERGAINTPWDA